MFLRDDLWHSTSVVVVFAFVLVLQNFFLIVYIFIPLDLYVGNNSKYAKLLGEIKVYYGLTGLCENGHYENSLNYTH